MRFRECISDLNRMNHRIMITPFVLLSVLCTYIVCEGIYISNHLLNTNKDVYLV